MIEYKNIKFESAEEFKARYDKHWERIERPKRRIQSFLRKMTKQDSNPVIIAKEAEQMRGEIVLDLFNIARFIGWTDQYEEDYYWILLCRNKEGKPYISLSSCVGTPTRLNKRLPTFEYMRLDAVASMNFYDIELGLKLCEERGIIIK